MVWSQAMLTPAHFARAGYRWTVENSIYLATAMQGRGIGKSLLGELIAVCEQRGFLQMIAVIGDADNLPRGNCMNVLDFARSDYSPESAANTVAGWTACRCNARSAPATPPLLLMPPPYD